MIYSLLILSSPSSGQSASSAVKFAQTLLQRGHTLRRVFFMNDGVYCAASHRVLAQDEVDSMQDWQEIAQQHGVDLVICVSSAIKRGLLDTDEATRYEKPGPTVNAAFTISGLGQLQEALSASDRLVTFGG